MPYNIIKLLATPGKVGKDALTAIVLYNMLETYRGYQEFVDAGDQLYGTLYGDTKVKSFVDGEKLAFQAVPTPSNNRKSNVIAPDLYRSTQDGNCPFVIVQVSEGPIRANLLTPLPQSTSSAAPEECFVVCFLSLFFPLLLKGRS